MDILKNVKIKTKNINNLFSTFRQLYENMKALTSGKILNISGIGEEEHMP